MIVLQYDYSRLEVDGEIKEIPLGYKISNFTELKLWNDVRGGRIRDHGTFNKKKGKPEEIFLISGKLLMFGESTKNDTRLTNEQREDYTNVK